MAAKELPSRAVLLSRIENLGFEVERQYKSEVEGIDGLIASLERLKKEIQNGGPCGFPGPHPVTIGVALNESTRLLQDVRGTFERQLAFQYLSRSE